MLKSYCWSKYINPRWQNNVFFPHSVSFLQVLVCRSWFDFLSKLLPQEGQENTSPSPCCSFWCLFRFPFTLKDFSHRWQLNVEKNGKWAWTRSTCNFRFLSKVKDFSHCPHFHFPLLVKKWASSICRFIFSTLLNCLLQWGQWCFSTGSLSGFLVGSSWTSLMCLLRCIDEIGILQMLHLTSTGFWGLPRSLLLCLTNSLKLVNSFEHFSQGIAFPWALSWWYCSDLLLEKTLLHPGLTSLQKCALLLVGSLLWTQFSWLPLFPLVENNLLQNWHECVERAWATSSSSFSSLQSSLPWSSSSLSVPSSSSLWFSITSLINCSKMFSIFVIIRWDRLPLRMIFCWFSLWLRVQSSFQGSCVQAQGPSGFSRQGVYSSFL